MEITNNIAIAVRRTEITDLEQFFLFQLDEQDNFLAAFTAKDPSDKTAYLQKYSKFVNDPTINFQTILVNNMIAGSISKFEMEGRAEITYWLDIKYWGKGVATTALKKLLTIEPTRPIFERVAFDNSGSQKVLEKAGFIKVGTDKGFSYARQAEIYL